MRTNTGIWWEQTPVYDEKKHGYMKRTNTGIWWEQTRVYDENKHGYIKMTMIRGISRKRYPHLPVCTRDKQVVSIEREYIPSTFYMKSAVDGWMTMLKQIFLYFFNVLIQRNYILFTWAVVEHSWVSLTSAYLWKQFKYMHMHYEADFLF